MTFQRRTARKIIDLVRQRRPEARIVVGGYDPSLAPEAWTDVADVIVRGEGEITFRELLRAPRGGPVARGHRRASGTATGTAACRTLPGP